MAPSLSTAGRHVQMETPNSAEDAKEQKELKSYSYLPPSHPFFAGRFLGGVWRGGLLNTVASANDTYLPSALGAAHEAPDPLYLGERYEMLLL